MNADSATALQLYLDVALSHNVNVIGKHVQLNPGVANHWGNHSLNDLTVAEVKDQFVVTRSKNGEIIIIPFMVLAGIGHVNGCYFPASNFLFLPDAAREQPMPLPTDQTARVNDQNLVAA